MDGHAIRRQVLGAPVRSGAASACLRVGNRHVRIEGLDSAHAAALGERWGAFVERTREDPPAAALIVTAPATSGWLALTPGEGYRLEPLLDPEHRVLVSYNFALARAERPGEWRLAVHEQGGEPAGRIFDNALRYLVARMALELGGFALHAGGVLRDGRAHLFAGVSGSGKSTAVRLSAPAPSLGDDFAIVFPCAGTWVTLALPFDNAERIAHNPPLGVFPLARVWRLVQARRHVVAHPSPTQAVAALLGCAAFPWALPEHADALLTRAMHLTGDGVFAELHFAPDPGFWNVAAAPFPAPAGR